MLKKLFISILFICTIKCISAQHTKVVEINFYSDQQVYVRGEMIWIDGRLDGSVSSKFIDVSLFDRNGNEKAIVSLLNRDGRFSGYIEVPNEIRSDFYFLDCSIKGMSTKSLVKPVVIIHPAYPPLTCQTTDKPPRAIASNTSENMVISGKRNYPVRGEVTFNLTGLREMSNISVDVVRDDLLSAYADSIISTYSINSFHAAKGNIESEGHQVLARVLSIENGLPVKGVGVYASIMGHQASLSYGISNSSGEVKFLFAPVLTETRIVFSVPEKNAKQLKVEMVDDLIVHEPIVFPCLVLREEMKSDIEERLFNVNVMRQFGLHHVKQRDGFDFDTTDFYGKPDARYLLDNYVRFPDMKEILFEFVPEVRVKKNMNDSGFILEVLNDPYKKYFTESAMVMLDGVPIQHVNELLEFDPLKLKSIDVVSRLYFLGDIQFNGIVHYKSYTKDLAGFTLTPAEVIYPFRGSQGYPVTKFFNHKALKRNGLPDFRNLLYKETFINNKFKESLTIAFSASDSKGNFKIVVRGWDPTGKTGTTALTFSVQ